MNNSNDENRTATHPCGMQFFLLCFLACISITGCTATDGCNCNVYNDPASEDIDGMTLLQRFDAYVDSRTSDLKPGSKSAYSMRVNSAVRFVDKLSAKELRELASEVSDEASGSRLSDDREFLIQRVLEAQLSVDKESIIYTLSNIPMRDCGGVYIETWISDQLKIDPFVYLHNLYRITHNDMVRKEIVVSFERSFVGVVEYEGSANAFVHKCLNYHRTHKVRARNLTYPDPGLPSMPAEYEDLDDSKKSQSFYVYQEAEKGTGGGKRDSP